MKAIKWSEGGSLQNRILEAQITKPVVGEGATRFGYSDRYAYFVTWVSDSGKECKIKRAKTKCLSYYDGEYSVEFDENGQESTLYYRWGAWRTKLKCGEYSLCDIAFGYAREYQDPSF